jgi:DNA-binding Lrp family transcriptional regulator
MDIFDNFNKKNPAERDTKVDYLDEVISYLMSAGLSNKQIAERLEKPLSTIQRRTRRLIKDGVVEQKMEINYDRLGFRKVFFYIYINKARKDSLALELSKIEGTMSVSTCLGTSCDIVVFFIAKDSKKVLDFVQRIQSLENVEKVEWSEELYRSENMHQKLEFIKAKE